jgi:hypothetical protein
MLRRSRSIGPHIDAWYQISPAQQRGEVGQLQAARLFVVAEKFDQGARVAMIANMQDRSMTEIVRR